MAADSGIAMKSLRVDGGASANNYLMQTMADISDLEVKRPRCVETTALGAAYLAGLAVGYWQSAEDITRNWSVDRVFRPDISEEERTKRIKAGIRPSAAPITGPGTKRNKKRKNGRSCLTSNSDRFLLLGSLSEGKPRLAENIMLRRTVV